MSLINFTVQHTLRSTLVVYIFLETWFSESAWDLNQIVSSFLAPRSGVQREAFASSAPIFETEIITDSGKSSCYTTIVSHKSIKSRVSKEQAPKRALFLSMMLMVKLFLGILGIFSVLTLWTATHTSTNATCFIVITVKWKLSISCTWDSLSLTCQLLDLVRTKLPLVSFMEQWHFIPEEKGLQYCIHGHTVICIMTMMNNPSGTIWEKRLPNSPSDACWLCLFMAVRLMREQYGGGWMDTCYMLPLK